MDEWAYGFIEGAKLSLPIACASAAALATRLSLRQHLGLFALCLLFYYVRHELDYIPLIPLGRWEELTIFAVGYSLFLLLRSKGRWRFVGASQAELSVKERVHFSLGQLLILTTAVIVLLGCCSLVQQSRSYLIIFASSFAALFLSDSLSVHWINKTAAQFKLGYQLMLAVSPFVLFVSLYSSHVVLNKVAASGPGFPIHSFLGLEHITFTLGLIGTQILYLMIQHSLGFRLVRQPDSAAGDK